MSHLTNRVYTNEHRDLLSSPDVKNTLNNIHKDFVVFLVDKAIGNISLVCKRFYASVITRELGLSKTHLQVLTTKPVAYLQMISLIKI